MTNITKKKIKNFNRFYFLTLYNSVRINQELMGQKKDEQTFENSCTNLPPMDDTQRNSSLLENMNKYLSHPLQV